MASMQELLSAVNGMQSNAQAALPVLPNNGNPAGAYNMPQSGGGPAQPAPRGPDLTWLQPSDSMQRMHAMLLQRRQYLDSRLAQINQQPPVPPVNAPVLPQPTVPQQPLTPQPVVTAPQMPQFNGVVLPIQGGRYGMAG